MKQRLKDIFERIARNPKTSVTALVGAIALVATFFGRSISDTSQSELAGAIMAIIAVLANLFMKDHKEPPEGQ